MKTLITLFPIAGLLIIAMWFFYETKAYFAFIKWFSKAKNRFVDFFCNICERIHEDCEIY